MLDRHALAGSNIKYNNTCKRMRDTASSDSTRQSNRCYCIYVLYQYAYATYAPGSSSVHVLQRTNVRRHENATAKKKTRSSIPGSIKRAQWSNKQGFRFTFRIYGAMPQDMTSAHASPLTTDQQVMYLRLVAQTSCLAYQHRRSYWGDRIRLTQSLHNQIILVV